jgi:radical SAM superfamily enzyme YgiQ (UPF0313 family)
MKIIRYLLDGLGHDKIVFLEMLPYASQYINTACEKNNYVEIETEEKYENDVIEKVEYLRRVLTSNDMKSKRELSIKNIKESTSNELLNQQNIFGKLIEEGFIVPICNGVYAYGGIFLHVFNYFCEKINMFGKKSFSSIVEYEVPAIGGNNMKITLIEPKAPGKHVYSNVTMPRLGLPILGTLLQKAGHQVRLIMGSSKDIHLSEITDADLICISTTTSTAVEAYHLADFARDQGKPVIMGGAHVSFMSEEALDHCDYVCRGEADLTFMPLISCIERGELPSDIPGVSYRQGEQIVHNPDADWVDFNSVPFPDLSLFSGLKMTTYPVMTSRGCPFDCTFCSVTKMFGRKFRYRETEALLEELKQYRGKQVFFVDDNFSANTRRTKELLREMIRQDIKPSWWCTQVRTDAARDDELLQLMYDSNCRMVFVGMESVNPETLKSYNKKQDVEDIEYCIQRFHNLGIMVHGMFVFGADEDSLQTIEETLDFALKNCIDTVQFLILTPLPGTKTFFDLEQEGRLLTRDWNLYDAHHVVFQPWQMSPYELQTATIQAFKKFFFQSAVGIVYLCGLFYILMNEMSHMRRSFV